MTADATATFMQTANRLPVLWTLAREWDVLLDKLDDPEADPDEVQAELEQLAGDIKAKAYGVAVVIQKLEKMAAWNREEARRMADMAKRDQAHADRVRAYALACMKAIGEDHLRVGSFDLAIRTNPPSVHVIDGALVPSEFQRTTITTDVDKRAVLEAFKRDGEIVPGTEVVRGERLEMR